MSQEILRSTKVLVGLTRDSELHFVPLRRQRSHDGWPGRPLRRCEQCVGQRTAYRRLAGSRWFRDLYSLNLTGFARTSALLDGGASVGDGGGHNPRRGQLTNLVGLDIHKQYQLCSFISSGRIRLVCSRVSPEHSRCPKLWSVGTCYSECTRTTPTIASTV